jgi:hypothetical protein
MDGLKVCLRSKLALIQGRGYRKISKDVYKYCRQLGRGVFLSLKPSNVQ